jgi:hypothetical protein
MSELTCEVEEEPSSTTEFITPPRPNSSAGDRRRPSTTTNDERDNRIQAFLEHRRRPWLNRGGRPHQHQPAHPNDGDDEESRADTSVGPDFKRIRPSLLGPRLPEDDEDQQQVS